MLSKHVSIIRLGYVMQAHFHCFHNVKQTHLYRLSKRANTSFTYSLCNAKILRTPTSHD